LGIENNDGELKYSSNPFSESTYQHTCKDISISGDQLSAICRKIDGSFSPTVSSIKIRGISNQDGNFTY
jgi:hypothetical protein